MIQKKIKITPKELTKYSYVLESCEENYSRYLGEVFLVKNGEGYAIIYKNVVHALSGPPKEFFELVCCGGLEGNLEKILKEKAEEVRKKREKNFKGF